MNKKNIIGNNEIYLLWGDVTLLYNDDFNNHVSGETENFNNGYSFDGEYSGNNLGDFNYDSQDSISNIVQYYNNRESYLKSLVSNFSSNNLNIENQIIELFNNVRNILENRDLNLIKNSINSISQGRENALRCINDQNNYLDENTKQIMNVIIDEYSNHLNYLNKAVNILR